MIITVDVTQEDIELGVPKSICGCPVARSLKRLGYSEVYAGYGEIEMDDYCGSTPSNAENFMLDFDKGRPCKPFSFELNIKEKENDYE